MQSSLSHTDIQNIVQGCHHDPFQVLGMHPVWTRGGQTIAVRAFIPGAESINVVSAPSDGGLHLMSQLDPAGFFEAILDGVREMFEYQLEVTYPGDRIERTPDPYAFPPLLSNYDLHLIREGNHLRIYEKLGAHPVEQGVVNGVAFAVWAPSATCVSVVGDFNHWDGRRHPMRVRGSSGVWEIFIPNVGVEALYKYEVRTQGGAVLVKSDPYAMRMELRPQTASIVYQHEDSEWSDEEWMSRRRDRDWLTEPVSIYEVHLGSWRKRPEEGNRSLSYRELAHELVDYAIEMGYTHVELLPVMEHPLDESWGYQVLGFFAPTSRHGHPDDFKYFVNHCHQNGIGVLLDWVPAHFPRDAFGLATFDGTALYEHSDPRLGSHPDWGTLIFNYGRHEVRNFLCASAMYWLDKYHVDGLRVDAVASMLYLDYSRKEGEWIPNSRGGRENLDAISFLRSLNETVYAHFPGTMMIAEESTAWPAVSRPIYLGGLGFGLKWNMGWMNDILAYFSRDPIHRKYHHDHLTFGLIYAFHENFVLPLSHDEVVHGKRSLLDKMPGDGWQKFANLRLLYAFMYAHPGKKMLFMGGEIGQWDEWNHAKSLDWHLLDHEPHWKLRSFVRDLNAFYRGEPALFETDYEHWGFEWIDLHDTDQNIISFLRRPRNGGPPVIMACNFTPVPRFGYRIGVPEGGFYREVLNSDSEHYGGSNLGNVGGIDSDGVPWHGRPDSLKVTLPPLSAVAFRRSAPV